MRASLVHRILLERELRELISAIEAELAKAKRALELAGAGLEVITRDEELER